MRPLAPLASLLALVVISANGHAQFAKADACSLLTATEAGTAIGAPAKEGHHLMEPSKGECIWSDDPSADLDRRRVSLSIMAKPAFDHMKGSPALKSEPVQSVGDEAYYIMPGGGAGPILIVRKGTGYFQIKVLNGFKVKPPLKPAEQKARELVLGQAAAGRI